MRQARKAESGQERQGNSLVSRWQVGSLIGFLDFQVFVSSLVAAVPVNLNGTDVLKETLVANKSVVSVGSCNFRFDYRDGFVTSPLQEENRVSVTPVAGKVGGFASSCNNH